jgi:hypothetical protein
LAPVVQKVERKNTIYVHFYFERLNLEDLLKLDKIKYTTLQNKIFNQTIQIVNEDMMCFLSG